MCPYSPEHDHHIHATIYSRVCWSLLHYFFTLEAYIATLTESFIRGAMTYKYFCCIVVLFYGEMEWVFRSEFCRKKLIGCKRWWLSGTIYPFALKTCGCSFITPIFIIIILFLPLFPTPPAGSYVLCLSPLPGWVRFPSCVFPVFSNVFFFTQAYFFFSWLPWWSGTQPREGILWVFTWDLVFLLVLLSFSLLTITVFLLFRITEGYLEYVKGNCFPLKCN